jgi:hypothetical protein
MIEQPAGRRARQFIALVDIIALRKIEVESTF